MKDVIIGIIYLYPTDWVEDKGNGGILSWNCNSLRYTLGAILNSGQSIVCVTETKQLPEELRRSQDASKRRGKWLHGAAAKMTEKKGRSGGVAVITSSWSTPIQATPELEELKRKGQLVIVKVAHKTHRAPLLVACLYGRPDEQEKTVGYLENLMDFFAGFPDSPALLAGDWNKQTEDGWGSPLLTNGHWRDGMVLLNGREAPKTCHKATESTRIDHIWVNRILAAQVQEAEAICDGGAYPHDPIGIKLREEGSPGMRVQMPKEAQMPRRKGRTLEENWLREASPRWNQLLVEAQRQGRSEEYYSTLSRRWEDYMGLCLDPQLQKGRGPLQEKWDEAKGSRTMVRDRQADYVKRVLARSKALRRGCIQDDRELEEKMPLPQWRGTREAGPQGRGTAQGQSLPSRSSSRIPSMGGCPTHQENDQPGRGKKEMERAVGGFRHESGVRAPQEDARAPGINQDRGWRGSF